MNSKGESNIESFIGCGINQIEASGPYIRETTSTLFKPEGYVGMKPKGYSSFEYKARSFDKLQEVFGSTGVSGGAKAGEAVALFTGGFESKYEKGNNVSSCVKFYRGELIKGIAKYEIDSELKNPSKMKNIIKQAVLDDINDRDFDPKEVFKAYGTHIIISASIGGKIEFFNTYRSSESIDKNDFENSLNASCKYFDAKGSLNRNTKKKKYFKDTTMWVQAYGGKNPPKEYGVFASIDEIIEKHKDWFDSVNEEPEISVVHDYMPIWKLADSKERSTQIEQVFYKLAEEKYNKVAKYYTLPEVKEVALRLLPVRSQIERQKAAGAIISNNPCDKRSGTLGMDSVNISYERRVKMLGWTINSNNTFIMYTNDDNEGTVSFFSKSEQKFLTVHVNSVFDKMNMGCGDIHQLYLISDKIGDREKFKLEKCNNNLYKIKSIYSKKYINCMYVPGTKKAKDYIIFTANAEFNDAREFELVDKPNQ